MNHVPISIIKAGLHVSERHGIPRATLLGRPSVEERELTGPLRRISWDSFCEFNDRIEHAWSSLGGVEQFALAVNEQVPEILAVARRVLSPLQLLRLVISVGSWAHPRITVRSKLLGPERLQLELSLPEDWRDSPAFFRISGASLANTPRLIGLPRAQVEMELVPHRAVYRFQLPPSRTAFSLGSEVASHAHLLMLERISHLQAEVSVLLRTPRGGSSTGARRRFLAWRGALTARQTEVLELVAQGISNREIANRLRCAERTVEVHITDILKKSGNQSRAQLIAAFWGALG
ncbi:helix-turn-helix transcriptional regulator [Myxococcus xanthus]|uniref:helix-turn-helix transcriptional regulator n=1 Tax=Myxococcus TaxID=32 RepID=UPI0003230BDA|nr:MULTISPECIES: helix-turn-helix transcriptional regulator [Myxococcus]QVW68132.1 helix-turn-helix transcriptional regulator [Myxococcus xanthus DZ2]QZZ54363.1 hypothetical protein MyxoNM_34560 [Myxococcus xanthus]UEO05754.1 helix-turn-helix transcriptional regulator [Myxococcus xanthus DZ2]UYI14003.1 helix-turn-helix transcriptional regulator [Myxococcus xanthus]UYI21370.1 helix-turn-helix transcriptional regulator [Myxococcus xanthus]